MWKKLLVLLLILAMLPASVLAAGDAGWQDDEFDMLVMTEERYSDLMARAVEAQGSKVKRKYGSLFTRRSPMDMIREAVKSGDTAGYLQARAVLLYLRERDSFTAEQSAWLDELFALGYPGFPEGNDMQLAAVLDAASADPALEPLLTLTFMVFEKAHDKDRTRLEEFLEMAGYTGEEYAEDAGLTAAFSATPETCYACLPDGTAALILYAGEGGEYEILSEYEGCPVTVIGPGAFRNTGVYSVTIPDTVRVIEKAAFANTALSAVDIPDGVTRIGEGAFAGCRLESVTLPAGITEISDYTFAANPHLRSLVIPDGVRSIGGHAFSMSGLPDELVIPGSVETIGEYAFAEIDVQLSRYMSADPARAVIIPRPVSPEGILTVVIGDGVKSIGKYAFAGRPAEEFFLPASVESVGECAFGGTYDSFTDAGRLKRIGVAPENPVFREIDGSLFDRGGERLVLCVTDRDTYTVPEGTRVIGSFAFCNGEGLVSVVLPESLAELENYAFFNCPNLAPVAIPAGVAEIGQWALYVNAGLSETVSVLVAPGSAAEQYCAENSIPFGYAP